MINYSIPCVSLISVLFVCHVHLIFKLMKYNLSHITLKHFRHFLDHLAMHTFMICSSYEHDWLFISAMTVFRCRHSRRSFSTAITNRMRTQCIVVNDCYYTCQPVTYFVFLFGSTLKTYVHSHLQLGATFPASVLNHGRYKRS